MEDLKLRKEIADRYMTIEEVCAARGVHRTTVIDWMGKGLPCAKVAKIMLMRRDDAMTWQPDKPGRKAT